MTSDGTPITCDPIETVLQALEQQDAVAAASAFAPDGRLVDPQFPAPTYRGRERVREALEWSLTNLAAKPAFEIRHLLEDDGTCALEVESRRAGSGAASGRSRKAFFVEVGDDGITHWRTYLSRAPDEVSRTGGEPIR